MAIDERGKRQTIKLLDVDKLTPQQSTQLLVDLLHHLRVVRSRNIHAADPEFSLSQHFEIGLALSLLRGDDIQDYSRLASELDQHLHFSEEGPRYVPSIPQGAPFKVWLAGNLPMPTVPVGKTEEVVGDEGSEADWLAVKIEALKLLQAQSIDTPSKHLEYVRSRIDPVFDNVE